MSNSIDRTITVIHTSDSRVYRKGVRAAMERKGGIEFIGEASNGQELLDMLEHRQPDIVLLDISMVVMNGMECLPLVKKKYPSLPVLMLSVHTAPETIIRTLEMGACGYVTIDAESDEIYAAIISSFTPGIFLSKGAKRALNPSFEAVDSREATLIRLLARDFDDASISRELELSVRTVGLLIEKLMRRAKVLTREELVARLKKKPNQ
jgi:two-component system nitrate/nitrite response regulator NarL